MKVSEKIDIAIEYLERGWSLIPISPDTKRPLIKWLAYQDRHPTEDEITSWVEAWPDCSFAIVTGEISGCVVVDCDNEDAIHAAYDADMRSPIKVKTKRGVHLYFEHPKDGTRRGPRAGNNSRGEDWPKINGLDFRGDGSYALLPPSSGYHWDYPTHTLDWDDMPMWKDWTPSLDAHMESKSKDDGFSFGDLDLSGIEAMGEFVSEWDNTARYVLEKYPTTRKLPTGMSNGRNERVMRWISECIMDGYFGDELRLKGYSFMNEFYVDPLEAAEYEATVRSMEAAERRNHPERFTDTGEYIPREATHVTTTSEHPAEEKPPAKTKRLIQMKDAEDLMREADGRSYLIEPWLPPATIVQVHGYSGHGKSMFLQHALGALTAGRKYFGPFEIGRAARVLYLDYEMGMSTIARRLMELRTAHGDTGDRLQIWTPFVEGKDMSLLQPEGLAALQEWVINVKPDVVVIDTIRSAFPGLKENDAQEWSRVNQLATRLRNSGYAVIMVHHSNKPGENGKSGREAGSSNQLTVLETQIKVTQVFPDEETARENAGIWDEDYTKPVWDALQRKCPADYKLYMVNEIRYGKVREWSDLHDRLQWVGYAANTITDERTIVSSRSTKQKAKDMAIDGWGMEAIADRLSRPLSLVRDWLEVHPPVS